LRTLTFDLLDDCIMAAETGKLQAADAVLSGCRTNRIGPLVEHAMFRARQFPALSTVMEGRISRKLQETIRVGAYGMQGLGSSLAPQEVEFAWGPPDVRQMDSAEWVAFCKRLEFAARRAQLANLVASSFTAAFREIVENSIIHSNRPETVVVGYRWSSSEVEFVVADAGVGALSSLQTCHEYQHLTDHGEALRIALSDGASRFGPSSGHGMGFRPIFVNLLGAHGYLRFRTGDHVFAMSSVQADLTRADLRQRPHYQGFMVSFVYECKAAQTGRIFSA
jgi:hypothetical protein